MGVRLDEQGLWLDDELRPLISGSVQYWRHAPEAWPGILDRVCELGLGLIETYAPWSVHELSRGRFDFTGAKDLGRFLDLAHARGLKVWLRPGPHIKAELTGFGFPERILADPRIQARGAGGQPVWIPAPPRMFPAPSLASEKLYSEFQLYLQALAEILVGRQHPDGPVALLQADDECHFFLRSGAYDQDYSEAALAAYRRFLRFRHHSLEELERAHALRYGEFARVMPPREFDLEELSQLPRHLDWAEFKESLLRRAVFRVTAMLREQGLRLPVTHNLSMAAPRSPLDPVSLEQGLDLAGMDFHANRYTYASFRARCLELAGRSRHPTASEFASGGQLVWWPNSILDQTFLSLAALMHGIRGFNFYMLAERDRWCGAPILSDGSLDPERRDWLRRWLRLRLAVEGHQNTADVALLSTPLAERIESLSQVLSPLPAGLLGLLGAGTQADCLAWTAGQDRAPARDLVGGRARFAEALDQGRLPYLRSDLRRGLDADRFRLVCLPTARILDRETALKLLAYARAGGRLVLGPALPEWDERGRPMEVLKQAVASGEVRLWADLLEAEDISGRLQALALELGCALHPDPGCPEVETALCRGAGDDCLWLANPGEQARLAELELPGLKEAWDLWRQRPLKLEGGRLRVDLPPWSVRAVKLGGAT